MIIMVVENICLAAWRANLCDTDGIGQHVFPAPLVAERHLSGTRHEFKDTQ
jgi:hypothetical protein